MRCHPVRKTRKDRPDETDPPVILMAAQPPEDVILMAALRRFAFPRPSLLRLA
jgi:hypothetical protein